MTDGSKTNESRSNNESLGNLSEKDGLIKKEIEQAGCEYQDQAQLLQSSVCIKPGYDKTIAPYNNEWATIVDVRFDKFKVSKVYDKDNRFQLLINQYMEWEDEGIRSNEFWARLTPSAIEKIWTPESDFIIPNIGEWKSLNEPYVYTWIYTVWQAELRNRSGGVTNASISTIAAQKNWKVDIGCDFRLGSYPLDTQICRFEYETYWTSFFLHPGDDMGLWKYTAKGFHININFTGSFIEFNNTR